MRFRRLFLVLLSLLLGLFCANRTALYAFAQECPERSTTGASIPSESRTLEGQLIYHDGIRKWLELKLPEPQCGQHSIQLVAAGDRDWTSLETLRGCRVESIGEIDFAGTGYFSLDTYQSVEKIEPAGFCAKQLPFPDYSQAKPDKRVRAYRVEMDIDYSPGDHPILFHVSSSGKDLQPWEAYASYSLTGSFVLYGECGEGFRVDKVYGTPQANPGHFTEKGEPDDMAAFDPENAAAAGKKKLRLGYTCMRDSEAQ